MPDLGFTVESAAIVPFAAAPLMAFTLRVTNAPAAETIHSALLRCQVQLDVTRRHYSAGEQKRLLDLFGEPARWSNTLRTMLWTITSVTLPAFTGETRTDVHIPCSFDFNTGATKYFYGVHEGDIPLTFLFSGSVFYENGAGALQVAPISWEKEARFRLPVQMWRQLIDHYYPNVAWLTLRRDVFDRLLRYKTEHGIATWEQAFEAMLADSEERAPI
jgi:Family of unknown function (DUF6084)